MTSISVKFTDSKLSGAAFTGAARKARRLAAEGLLTEANKTVPLDEAVLEASGMVSHDDAANVSAVSYNTPYAVVQHEDTTLNHPQQGRAKWLELTMNERARIIGEFIAGRIRSEVQ